jgi:hypothetical protein
MSSLSVRRFCLALFFCITTGCASFSNPSFEAQVETTHSWLSVQQSSAPRTFVIESIKAGSLNNNSASSALASSADPTIDDNVRSELISGMERQGFDLASSRASPNYWIEVEYTQDQATRYRSNYQPYPYVSYGSDRDLLGVLILSSVLASQSRGSNTQEYYRQQLKFIIRTKPKTQASSVDIVYEAQANSESLVPNLEKALPWLVLSIFDDFPKESGSKKLVKIPYNSNRYYTK